jgi:hypothetical protein
MSDNFVPQVEVKLSFARPSGDGYTTYTLLFNLNTTPEERDILRDMAFEEAHKIGARHYDLGGNVSALPSPAKAGKVLPSYEEAQEDKDEDEWPEESVKAAPPAPKAPAGKVSRIPWDHEGKFGKPSYAKGTPITDISTDYLEWYVNSAKNKSGFWYDACVAELKTR